GQAVALPPTVELRGRDPQPGDESSGGDLGALRPVADVIDDGGADVVGNPGFAQSSPCSFFSLICSSINSATTSFLRWSFSRSAAMVRRWWFPAGLFFRSKAAAPFSKKIFCHA